MHIWKLVIHIVMYYNICYFIIFYGLFQVLKDLRVLIQKINKKYRDIFINYCIYFLTLDLYCFPEFLSINK